MSDPVTGGILIASTGMEVYGKIAAANAQSQARAQELKLKNIQADEILSREAVNEQVIQDNSKRTESAYSTAFAATGREGAGVGGQIQIHKFTQDQVANLNRDANFKANMIRAGANIEANLASDVVSASYISGAGTLLTSGLRAYDAFKGPSNVPNSLSGWQASSVARTGSALYNDYNSEN